MSTHSRCSVCGNRTEFCPCGLPVQDSTTKTSLWVPYGPDNNPFPSEFGPPPQEVFDAMNNLAAQGIDFNLDIVEVDLEGGDGDGGPVPPLSVLADLGYSPVEEAEKFLLEAD